VEITAELITYLEELGRIRLSDSERSKTEKDLGAILGYIDKLNELDTEGVEPLSHAFPVTNVFREDVVTNTNRREEILSTAPDRKNGFFKVPKTVE